MNPLDAIAAAWGWVACLFGRHARGSVHYVTQPGGIMVPVKRCRRCKNWY